MADEPVEDADSASARPAQSTPLPSTTLPADPADTGYTSTGVPTFESVREKIETRFGTALGAAELDADTPEGRSVEEQYEARQRAAAERLAQIRASMQSGDDAKPT